MTANPSHSIESRCPRCLTSNQCAIANNQAATGCWCMQVPTRNFTTEKGETCYCEKCLRELTNGKTETINQ